MGIEGSMSRIERILGFVLICCWAGHDWFNGGEACRDCRKPRPPGWLKKNFGIEEGD